MPCLKHTYFLMVVFRDKSLGSDNQPLFFKLLLLVKYDCFN